MSIKSIKSITVLVLACAALQLHANTEVVDGIAWTYTTFTYGSVRIAWVDNDGEAAIPTSTTGDVVIPSTLGGYPVTSIGEGAFYDCRLMTSVTIPDSVTDIGEGAFTFCKGLTNVVIGVAVVDIGDYAFTSCANLQTVYLPSGSSALASAFPAGAEIVYYGGTEPEPTPQVIVSFDANGAAGDVPEAMTCEEGDVVTLPGAGNLVMARHTFSGWLYEGAVLQPDSELEVGSTNVVLTAVWTLVVEPINAALDNLVLEFETGGAAPWFVTNNVFKTGGSSMRSGAIGHGTNTWIETTVRGEGEVSFWLKASSEAYKNTLYDFASFTIDGVELATLGGEAGWTSFSFDVVGEGPHVLRWTYFKDEADSAGEDCAWLDDVVWTPNAPPELLPTLAADATPEAVTNAIDSAGFAEADAVKAAIGGDAQKYAAFKEWAGGVMVPVGSMGASSPTIAGEAAVVANTNAAVAFLLGSERLFENAPKVVFEEVEVRRDEGIAPYQGGQGANRLTMAVRVVVKDGEEEVKCAAERVKEMFEATSDLGDWAEGDGGQGGNSPAMMVDVEVEEPVAGDSAATMRFSITPSGAEGACFIRVKVK